MDIRIQCLSIHTTDPLRLATFWQAALGWRLEAGPSGNEVVLEPPEGSPEDGVAPVSYTHLTLPTTPYV